MSEGGPTRCEWSQGRLRQVKAEEVDSRLETFLEPVLRDYRGQPPRRHCVLVAHGIFNAELIGALLARRRGDVPLEWAYRGESGIAVDGRGSADELALQG